MSQSITRKGAELLNELRRAQGGPQMARGTLVGVRDLRHCPTHDPDVVNEDRDEQHDHLLPCYCQADVVRVYTDGMVSVVDHRTFADLRLFHPRELVRL